MAEQLDAGEINWLAWKLAEADGWLMKNYEAAPEHPEWDTNAKAFWKKLARTVAALGYRRPQGFMVAEEGISPSHVKKDSDPVD